MGQTNAFCVRASLPALGVAVDDVATTGYADDLARGFLLPDADALEVADTISFLDRELDDALATENLVQNREKRVLQVRMAGRGGPAIQREIYNGDFGVVCQRICAPRYLGPLLPPDAGYYSEAGRRIAASANIFRMLSSFWAHGPRKFASIFLRGACFSTLLSGAVAFCPSATQLKRMDRQVAQQSRKLHAKRASGFSLVDGEASYSPISNAEVFKIVGWATSATELKIQRLCLWQRVSRDGISKHRHLLCAVFGRLFFEPRAEIDVAGDIHP